MSSFPKKKLKLLCDENLPKKVVELLREEGFNVKQAPFSSPDEMVARLAKTERRIILTFDRHFANRLLFPPEEYSGIVFIKIRPPFIKTVFSALLNLFNSVAPEKFEGKLYSLSAVGFRMFPRKIEDFFKRAK